MNEKALTQISRANARRFKPPFATLTDATGTHIVGGSIRGKDTVLIRDSIWEKIREQFSEDEKLNLRQAMIGQAICPKGVIIDPDILDVALEFKITAAVKNAG
jgi:hypothetical protein